jgi:aminopeptidase N
MENTSATTQTDRVLHDERAHLDFSGDPLVSHELAHQWFGDLLTCRDWSHGWLNEGFATFMERVWIENNSDPDGGLDAAKYYSYQDLKEYLEEDREKYRRPIVCNTYIEPMDLFDTHLYQKGGLVLNLIRSQLGEDLFWQSIHTYVTRHRGQNVETLDLIRAIEDTTGRNLRRFFDEWIFGAGYPEFEISYEWHEDKKLAEIIVEQKQTRGQLSFTENEATTHLFHLSAVIELTLEGGKKLTHTVEIGEARDRIFLPAPSKPWMVRFDPGNTIPKTLKFPRPKELLLYQLKNDSDCMGRIEAAKELGKIANAEITSALAEALLKDRFWGVQAEIACVLGEIRTESARDALITGLKLSHPKARRAVVSALGTFKDSQAASALKKLAQSDPSYYVEAEAIGAWTGSRRFDDEGPTEKFLLEQLTKESFQELIRSSALKGLGELPGTARGQRAAALTALIDWTKKGKPMDARLAAIRTLGSVAKIAVPHERARVFDLFSRLSDEDHFRIRMALLDALACSESSEALSLVEKIRSLDVNPRVRRRALVVRAELQEAGGLPESFTQLRSAYERLEEEQRKLKSALEELRNTPAR